MKRIVAVAMTLIGLTAVAVVPGEWNSDFGTSLAYAEKYHLPIVVVWGNTSCHYCDELEAVFQDEGLTSWTSKHSILMVSKSEAIDSQDADNLAAKEWIKSLANVSSYPFVGVYWKKADSTVACSTAFVGRKGMMPATSPSDDLAGQLANSLDQLVGDYYPIADAGYYTNTVDGVEWVFAVKDGEASIGTGHYESAISDSTEGALVIPAILGGCPVTEIGYYAFGNCDKLTSVTIPDSVLSVGEMAFEFCKKVSSVGMSGNLTTIGEYAFYGCEKLSEVSIPLSVQRIDDFAFRSCPSLGEGVVIVDDCVLAVNGKPTDCTNEVILPSSVRLIAGGAFYGSDWLESIAIPNGVTSIGGSAFRSTGLGSIVIPASVRCIGGSVFRDCSSLLHIEISEGVEAIGSYSFEGCENLESVEFAGRPPEVLDYSWAAQSERLKYTKLNSSVNVRYNVLYQDAWLPVIEACGFTNASPYTPAAATPDGGPYTNVVNSIQWVFTVIGGEASVGSGVYGETAIPQETAGEIVIPSMLGGCPVTGISDSAFRYCTSLTHVTIPDGVQSIGVQAFEECSGLQSVDMPDSLEFIHGYAFYGCRALSEMEFPSALCSIGYVAFAQCSALQSICLPQSIEYISVGAFSGCNASVEIDESCAFCASTYCVVDDMLFDSEMTRLVYCPTGKSGDVNIPYGVEEFDFSSCSNITSITLPKTVAYIPYWSLGGCSSLMEINIPRGVWELAVMPFAVARHSRQ